MKFPIQLSDYTQDAADFWWERHVSRMVKRRLMSRIAWQRMVKLLQLERPTLRKVMA